VTVSDLRLSVHQALLELQGRLTPALDMRASLGQVDAGTVNAFFPGLLSAGTLAAQLQLHGTPASPQGHAQFQVTDVRLAAPNARYLPAAEAHGTADLHGDAAQLEATFLAGDSQLALRGEIPLWGAPPSEGAPVQPDIPAAAHAHGATAGRIDLTLSGKVDLALANPLLDTYGRHAAGMLTVKAHVTGTPSAPEIGGDIELADGDLRDYIEGVHLSSIKARMTGSSHGELEITSLSARAGKGEVDVTGTVAVLQPHIPVQLHLKAREAQPLASDILTANLDADLELTGTLQERMRLSGTIHVNRADLGIPNGLSPDVAVLDVRRPGQAPAPAPARPLLIELDVKLDAPRQVLVTGRGLDAELGGGVHITGTSDSPQVSGGFDLIRGSLSIASTPLNFTSGRVTFTGAGLRGRIDPSLDFTAQSSLADSTAILRVTGLADSPQFQLSSSPQELPQDEILARLLFGQTESTLTASQVVTIGSALATITGTGSGINPLVRVQKSLGLDRLAVSGSTPGATGTQQTTGATVEAGRYVVSKVYVAAKQSTTGVTRLVVDVDLTRRLKLRTQLGNGSTTAQGVTPENDPGSSIGVSYQFEY
jgi:translocation and assembly module TamB